MGLFNARTQTQGAQVPPEVAECDKHLEDLNKRREKIFYEIGAYYVANNTVETATGTEFEGYMKEIKAIADETVVMEKRKLAVQGLRKCEKCGNILVLDSAFCNKCGEKLEPLFVPTEQNPHICTKCGSEYEEGALFCVSCGSKLE